MISKKFYHSIKEHPVLMKIADNLISRTKVIYGILLVIFTAGYFIPLIVQGSYEHQPQIVFKLCHSCLAVTLFFHLLEFFQMKQLGFKQYWNDYYSITNNISFCLYYYYYTLRLRNPWEHVYPLEYTEDKSKIPLSDVL